MTQDELKQAVARPARDHIAATVPAGGIIGVGTGSTANFFIDELAAIKGRIGATVASSEATKKRLEGHGIKVLDLNDVTQADAGLVRELLARAFAHGSPP